MSGAIDSKKSSDFTITWYMDTKRWWEFWKNNEVLGDLGRSFGDQVFEMQINNPVGGLGTIVLKYFDDIENNSIGFVDLYKKINNGTMMIDFDNRGKDGANASIVLSGVKIIGETVSLSKNETETPIEYVLVATFLWSDFNNNLGIARKLGMILPSE